MNSKFTPPPPRPPPPPVAPCARRSSTLLLLYPRPMRIGVGLWPAASAVPSDPRARAVTKPRNRRGKMGALRRLRGPSSKLLVERPAHRLRGRLADAARHLVVERGGSIAAAAWAVVVRITELARVREHQ